MSVEAGSEAGPGPTSGLVEGILVESPSDVVARRSLLNECVSGIELRRLLNSDLSRDRPHRIVEPVDGLLRVEDVEDQEAIFSLGCGVDDEPFEWKVRRGLKASLPSG